MHCSAIKAYTWAKADSSVIRKASIFGGNTTSIFARQNGSILERHSPHLSTRATPYTDTVMAMDNTAESPAQFVTSKQLGAHMHKPVFVAGRVTAASDTSLTLQGFQGEQPITVARASPALVDIETGMTVMIRGFVNQDLSIAESRIHPACDLGDKFGMVFSRFPLCACVFRGSCLVRFPLRRHHMSEPQADMFVMYYRLRCSVDLKLYSEAAAVTSQPAFTSMFTN